jgi:hypothetical protein
MQAALERADLLFLRYLPPLAIANDTEFGLTGADTRDPDRIARWTPCSWATSKSTGPDDLPLFMQAQAVAVWRPAPPAT